MQGSWKGEAVVSVYDDDFRVILASLWTINDY